MEWGLGDVLLATGMIFLWCCLLAAVLVAVVHLLRSHDLSGWAKAGWLVLLLVLPLIGLIAYVVVRRPAGGGGEMVDARAIQAAHAEEERRRAFSGYRD